jgi:hypothetical protein
MAHTSKTEGCILNPARFGRRFEALLILLLKQISGEMSL